MVTTLEDMNLHLVYKSASMLNSIVAGIDLGVFEYLNSNEFKSISEIKKDLQLEIKERNLLDFLDVLYSFKHLLREGKGINSKYKIAHKLFLKSNPDNLIPIIIHYHKNSERFNDVTTIIKTGERPNKLETFKELYSDPIIAEAFLKTMGKQHNSLFDGIVNGVDFSPYKKLVDIGGCLGNFSLKIKSKFPDIECFNFDIALVEPYFQKFMEEHDSKGKITFVTGDFFVDDFPKSDIIVMSKILHDWGDEKKKLLMKKSFDSLNENGILLVIEKFVSENRDSMEDGLIGSFLMLVACIEGFDMTREELFEYSKNAGFKKIEFLHEKYGCDGAICFK